MTDQEYNLWLSNLDARRVLLAEMGHSEGVEYVSTSPFISEPTDSDPNRIYDDLLSEAVDISTRIDGLIGFGEISLINDGQIDPWINYKWQGHPIRLYLGGPDWSRDDFRLLARGINGGMISPAYGEIRFAMRDQSTLLNEAIDTGQLPDDAGPVPLALGSVFNAPAYLLQPSPYEFKASFLPVISMAPKDNGTSISHTNDLANGSFELASSIVGTLTVDIEEQHNTPAQIAQWVADYYGITVGEISMPDYRVGLYYNREVSGTQILNELTQGLGAYWYLNALGEIVMRQHTAPGTADITLVSDEIVQRQIQLSSTEQPWKSATLRWRRNYSTLSTVAGSVSAEQAARLSREWNEVRGTQPALGYPLAESVTRDTPIQDQADASAERDRLLSLRSIRRDRYTMEAFLPPVTVGQNLTVDHPILAGKTGRIISISRSPTQGTTNLEIWV